VLYLYTEKSYVYGKTSYLKHNMNNDAFDYLKSIRSEKTTLSNERIKIILTASILRYFAGLTTIQFVIDVSSAIGAQHDIHLEDDMLAATIFIQLIGYQTEFENIHKNMIQQKLHTVLEKLM